MTAARMSLKAFLVFYALCFAVQTLGSHYTMISVHSWYLTLHKSALTPPGYVFGIAWSLLYFLMAVGAARVYATTGTAFCRPLRWWLIQLLLGLTWSILFFGHQLIQGGFIIITCNLVAVAVTLRQFAKTDRRAGWCLIPLMGWLLFATYLNLYMAIYNAMTP